MNDRDLAWHVEEACANAWPAQRQLLFGRWLLRAAGGATRRTNSINPLRGGPDDPAPIVAEAESAYAAVGQPTLFRVPDFLPVMDESLDRLGYTAEGESLTLVADLRGARAPDPSGSSGRTRVARAVEIPTAPVSTAWDAGSQNQRDGTSRPPDHHLRLFHATDEAWIAARMRLTDADAAGECALRATIGALVLPHVFVASCEGDVIAAVAFGALDRGMLVVEAVVTDTARRRRGHARAMLGALARWAAARGATRAALQVDATNAGAIALYRGLGFDTELYRYHYRRQPSRAPA
jgi:ribosomal protein S18 acetylase RimI-like enzyme